MKKKVNLFLFSIVALFLFNACSPVHRGYKFDKNKDTGEIKEVGVVAEMIKKNNTIKEIIDILGSPTFINSPTNDMVCYASADGTRIAFNRFYRPKIDVLCIHFDQKTGAVKDYFISSFTEIQKEHFTKYKY